MAGPRRVIYEDGPLWIEWTARVVSVEKAVIGSTATINRTERALMGGWDESGTQWIEGIRDKVGHLEEKTDSFVGLARWGIGVVTAIFIGLVIDMTNNYFGWWGSAHATAVTTKILTGGH